MAVTVLLLLIVYGSLYPLTWDFEHPQDFIYEMKTGLSDIVENVVLFLPLGWLLAWHYKGRRSFWAKQLMWFIVSLAVATVLQWLQIYLPRTPALVDIINNMVGHLVGLALGLASASAANNLLQRHPKLQQADKFAVVMVSIWVVAELFPLIPTLDVSSVYENVKSLWLLPFWQPTRMLSHVGMTVLGLEALVYLLRSASLSRIARPVALLVTLGMVGAKFVVIRQQPGVAVVLGIGLGGLVWLALDLLRESQRLMLVLLVAVLNYLAYELAPYQFSEFATPMGWVPFASSLSGSIEAVVSSVAFEGLCFGAAIWAAVRMGSTLVGVTICVAVMAFVGEWLQRYLPGRTAEITSVFTALAMGWLVSALRAPRASYRAQAPARRTASGTL